MKLILATQNKNKLYEIKSWLEPFNIEILGLDEVNLGNIDIEETADTFEENALIKAKAIYDILNIPVLADDSGLILESLPDLLGVHTARYMKDEPLEVKNQSIIDQLSKNRRAKFVCAMVYYDGSAHTMIGEVKGTISKEIRGSAGFGQDAIFIPDGYDKTMAELGVDIKKTISHRYHALVQLVEFFKDKV